MPHKLPPAAVAALTAARSHDNAPPPSPVSNSSGLHPPHHLSRYVISIDLPLPRAGTTHPRRPNLSIAIPTLAPPSAAVLSIPSSPGSAAVAPNISPSAGRASPAAGDRPDGSAASAPPSPGPMGQPSECNTPVGSCSGVGGIPGALERAMAAAVRRSERLADEEAREERRRGLVYEPHSPFEVRASLSLPPHVCACYLTKQAWRCLLKPKPTLLASCGLTLRHVVLCRRHRVR